MRNYILGAIVALSLLLSPVANATPFLVPVATDTEFDSEVQFLCYNTTTSHYDLCGRMYNGAAPYIDWDASKFYIGGSKLTDLLAAKANTGSTFSGAYGDLTGKPSLFSGVYTDLTSKPTIPTTTSQLTNNSGFLTSAPVASVAGKTGTVTLVKADVGLSNVDNTTDAGKPISTATQTALDAKAASSTTIGTGTTISAAATNANTSQVTNYNLVSGVLGLADGLNAANTAQNDLATKYNDLATKYNTLLVESKARTVPSN